MKIITFIAMATALSFGTTGLASQHEAGEQGQHKMCAHKGGMHGRMGQKRAMHHANPMPNLMMVVMKKSDELNLTADQQKALAAWREKSNPIITDDVGKVMMLEKDMMDASLQCADKASLMSNVDEMLGFIRDIADRKVICRDYL